MLNHLQRNMAEIDKYRLQNLIATNNTILFRKKVIEVAAVYSVITKILLTLF